MLLFCYGSLFFLLLWIAKKKAGVFLYAFMFEEFMFNNIIIIQNNGYCFYQID